MKKILYLVFIIQLFILPSGLRAENDTGIDSVSLITTEKQMAEVNILLARVNEIRAIDMTNMPASEKKELRQELNSIKRQLKEQKKAATNGPIGSLMWIIIGAGIGIIATLLFLLGAFN